MKIKEHKIPVIVLFEGWGASGKGSTIGKVIKNIDPRFFKVATMSTPTAEDLRYPFLYRYFKQIPEAGKFTFLDSGWMEQTCRECLEDKIEGEAYTQRIDSIRRFERQLTDNGYLVLKFFMQIDKEDQKERQKALLFHKDTKWRVSNFDKWQNDHYKKCAKIFSQYMSDTNASTAPWYIIDAILLLSSVVPCLLDDREARTDLLRADLQRAALRALRDLREIDRLRRLAKLDEVSPTRVILARGTRDAVDIEQRNRALSRSAVFVERNQTQAAVRGLDRRDAVVPALVDAQTPRIRDALIGRADLYGR